MEFWERLDYALPNRDDQREWLRTLGPNHLKAIAGLFPDGLPEAPVLGPCTPIPWGSGK